MDTSKMLEMDHIEAYLAVLAANPTFAGLGEVHTNVAVTSAYFMETVENVFNSMHEAMKTSPFHQYDHTLFDPTIEEVFTEKGMDRLCLFAEAVQPNWGEGMKHWIYCDKVIAVCNYKEHWGTVVLDLKKQKIILYDSKEWTFEYHHRDNRRDIFLPMARTLPQIMKAIGYYTHHRMKNP